MRGVKDEGSRRRFAEGSLLPMGCPQQSTGWRDCCPCVTPYGCDRASEREVGEGQDCRDSTVCLIARGGGGAGGCDVNDLAVAVSFN